MKQIKNSPVIMIIIGIAAIVFTFYSYNKQKNFLKNSVETKGVIVDIKEKYGSTTSIKRRRNYSNKTTYKPVVEFVTDDGKTIQFTSLSGSTNRNTYHIDDEIAVLYNPDKPENAQIKKSTSTSTPYISGGVGIIVFIIGIVTMFLKKKKINNINI